MERKGLIKLLMAITTIVVVLVSFMKFIPNSPMNHSVVRIFIVLEMRFLCPDNVLLD